MHNFTQYITETRKKLESQVLKAPEVTEYIKAVSKTVSRDIQNLLFLTQKYSLFSTDQIEAIRLLGKNDLVKCSKELGVPVEDLEDIWSVISKMKDNELRVLPQYQSAQEREGVINKKLRVSDLTIDLESEKGKREVVKMYTPLLNKIVNQFMGKGLKLNRAELMSAAMVGFNDAINDWDPDNDKQVSFKTYASYRVRQQILNDINEYGHSLSGTNWYAAQKAKKGEVKLDATSLDSFMNDDGDWTNDHLAALGVEDKEKDDTEHWKKVFKAIEDKFKVRDVDIFYRYFGLNGRKKEKSKDIAKSYGMSEGNIRNSVINKILAYLRTDKELLSILMDIQDIYNEGLMVEMIHMGREQILEALLNDDTFILLEEINRWSKKDVFMDAVDNAIEPMKDDDTKVIKDLLAGSFDDLDSGYKKNKRVIVTFLSSMYPTETFLRKSDVAIIDRMHELQETWKKFNK
jgi:RNA polymerase sigma factor (sigma-70 family)